MRRGLLVVAFVLCWAFPATAQNFNVASGGAPRSQLNFDFLGSNEYLLLNRFKESDGWAYNDNSGHPAPTEMDGLGYPLYGSTAQTKGVKRSFFNPAQNELATNYVATWVGGANLQFDDQDATNSVAACTGTITGSNECSNTGCSPAQGYFLGTSLTITSASSCNFVQGQPVSAARANFTATSSGSNLSVSSVTGTIVIGSVLFGPGVPVGTTIISGSGNNWVTNQPTFANGDSLVTSQTYVNPFGTPTIITNTNGNTGTGTYTVNYSQTVGSSGSPVTIYPGGRMEVAVTSENSSSGRKSHGWPASRP